MMPRIYKPTKGFGLLEVMLVIAVTAVAIFLATSYYSTVHQQNKISQTVNQVRGIVQGANAYLQALSDTNLAMSTGSGHELSTPLVQGAYIAPTDIINPWMPSSPYTIYILLTSPTAVEIKVKGLDKNSCAVIQTKLSVSIPHATCTHATVLRVATLIIPL